MVECGCMRMLRHLHAKGLGTQPFAAMANEPAARGWKGCAGERKGGGGSWECAREEVDADGGS